MNDEGKGMAGGGRKDTESAALAVEALNQFSYAPQNDGGEVDPDHLAEDLPRRGCFGGRVEVLLR